MKTSGASIATGTYTSYSADLADMLGELSPEELEIAARANYDYATNPRRELRDQYAMEMALRYLKSKSDKDKALAKMKATIQFRKNFGIDSLRKAVSDPDADDHLPLTKFLNKKTLYVSGYDNDGRSTLIFVPRNCDDHASELKAHVWTVERAIACSKAKDKTLNAVVDFAGFSSTRHAPPLSLGKEVMTCLRDHYVGSVNRIFIVNPPAAFSWLWSILKPFAGEKTREKVQFVTSERQKERLIGQWYSKDEAAAWMLPDGKKKRALDTVEYLHGTPFQQAFDENTVNKA